MSTLPACRPPPCPWPATAGASEIADDTGAGVVIDGAGRARRDRRAFVTGAG